MDPITTAVVGWAVSEVGDTGIRGLGLLRGDPQEAALQRVVARAIDLAVDEVVTEAQRDDVREALRRTLPNADQIDSADIVSLHAAVSRVITPRLEVLTEQGYEINTSRLAETVAERIAVGIQTDADRGGVLTPLAGRLRYERLATASEHTVAELQVLNRAVADFMGSASDQDSPDPVGWLIDELTGPLALGVHPAVAPSPGQLSDLPEYVPRAHDQLLLRVIDASRQDSAMVVLVGDSSTGKTRALWEAVRVLPHYWRVWSPVTAVELNVGLANGAVTPQTVVWLDDAHDYLDPGQSTLAADTAARLRTLIEDPVTRPVLVAATLWPEYWQRLTTEAGASSAFVEGSGIERGHSQIPALLTRAKRILIPRSFEGDDLGAVRTAARRDERLGLALENASGGKITQYLAGAPKLLERYETAPPEARAFIDAAIDARRFGHENRLPQQLLVEAAPGYLDSDSWDRLSDDWADQSLRELGSDWRGLPGPLAKIRPWPGQSAPSEPLYRLADILEQAGTRDRRYCFPPETFWVAAAHSADANNAAELGRAAQERGRYQHATTLYLKAGEHGIASALYWLALMREEAGDHENAELLAVRAARAGDVDALKLSLGTGRTTVSSEHGFIKWPSMRGTPKYFRTWPGYEIAPAIS